MRAEILPHQLTRGQYYAVEFQDITLGEMEELQEQGFQIEMNQTVSGSYLFIFKNL